MKINGLSVHPGYAFGQMKMQDFFAVEFAQMLPANETPATTKGFEGFSFNGN